MTFPPEHAFFLSSCRAKVLRGRIYNPKTSTFLQYAEDSSGYFYLMAKSTGELFVIERTENEEPLFYFGNHAMIMLAKFDAGKIPHASLEFHGIRE